MVMNIWPLAVKYTKICMSSKTTQVVLHTKWLQWLYQLNNIPRIMLIKQYYTSQGAVVLNKSKLFCRSYQES